MMPEEFIVYVDNLPDACIEKRTAEEVIFHSPKKKYDCPAPWKNDPGHKQEEGSFRLSR